MPEGGKRASISPRRGRERKDLNSKRGGFKRKKTGNQSSPGRKKKSVWTILLPWVGKERKGGKGEVVVSGGRGKARK